MLFNRIGLVIGALLLLAAGSTTVTYGQDHELEGAALFERADVRPYDDWAEQRNGLFFSFDGIYWHISQANKTTVGDPTLTPTVFVGPSIEQSFVEQSTVDTSGPSIWKWGDRTELGYIDGHHGFMFTALSTNSQTQETYANNAFVVFNDPAQGPLGQHLLDTILQNATPTTPAIIGETPVNFSSLYVQNKSRLQGVEALYIYRMDELNFGGQLEFLAGGRYFELKDQFWVAGTGGNLADSYWDTHTHNEIGGPEIGARFLQPIGRFAFSVESRFTAGINAQDIGQDGLLGSQLFSGIPQANGITLVNPPPEPTLMSATSFTHSTHYIEFSPIIELRAEARMQLTNMITVKAGYTGIFINNVARAADMINYTVPNMGITRDLNGNLQPVYIQGLNIGVEVNR
jgi:hypothetical protein